MKTKFKSFLTLSLVCIGLVSLLLSASGNLSNNPQNEVGAYQIATMSDSGILYRLDTSCLLYTSPSPRDGLLSRMPSSA